MSTHQEFVDLIIGIALKGRAVAFEFIKRDGSVRFAPFGRSFVRESRALRFWDSGVKAWRSCSDGSIQAIHIAGHRWTNPDDIVRALNRGMIAYGPDCVAAACEGDENRPVSWETARVW